MCFGLFSLFLLIGAPRNLLAAEAKLQDYRMTAELNISGLILQQSFSKTYLVLEIGYHKIKPN